MKLTVVLLIRTPFKVRSNGMVTEIVRLIRSLHWEKYMLQAQGDSEISNVHISFTKNYPST